MLFFELTWSPISQPAKDAIRVRQYRGLRAPAGEPPTTSSSSSSTTSHPIRWSTPAPAARGSRLTIGQTLCWAVSADWQSLPDEQQICTPDSPAFASRMDADEFVFITHSLGSRITTDGLQRLTRGARSRRAATAPRSGAWRRLVPGARRQGVHARQPAAPAPERAGAGVRPGRGAGLLPPGRRGFPDRLFKETELIAFSDPNDLLSYPIPDAFVRELRRLASVPQAGQRHHQHRPCHLRPRARRVRQSAFGARRIRRRRTGDRPDHPRHRPTRDRAGGQGALHLARGRREPALIERAS